MKHIVAILILGAGLSACSFYLVKQESAVLPIQNDGKVAHPINQTIAPYRTELSATMDEVIGYNPQFLSKARPCSPIHNWVADAVMSHTMKTTLVLSPVMVLLNHGGIRSALPEGGITLGNLYELMPFDNRLVWLKMPMTYLDTIESYLNQGGGEPIAGVRMTNGELNFLADFGGDDFWVLTSDYLANGGDQMSFFQAAIEKNETAQLLRDIFIETVQAQDTLYADPNCRIEMKP